jgi:hypothetical protein
VSKDNKRSVSEVEFQLHDIIQQMDLPKVVGYLNFSNGRPDLRFQKAWNEAQHATYGLNQQEPWTLLSNTIVKEMKTLAEQGGSAFQDLTQARTVLSHLTLHLIPRYRSFHQDTLGHLKDHELFQPLMVVRMLECLLQQTSHFDDIEKTITHTIAKLNDFLGYRPVATLENKQLGEAYPHERFRPIPLYIKDLGVGYGPYHALVLEAINTLKSVPESLLEEASFDLQTLEEWAYDPRCYDHSHPANRRPNYVFGEWDPHQLDIQGNYRRYISRAITLQILQQRVSDAGGTGTTQPILAVEYAKEAGIVLAGTVLMASAMSGRGPGSYDSSVKLATLVPRIAKLRDSYYAECFNRITGAHKDRLKKESDKLRQPFGGARQALNQAITKHRAAQLQTRHIAYFLADMGASQAAHERLGAGTPVSDRFQIDLISMLSDTEVAIERNSLQQAVKIVSMVEEHLLRGIDCGALPDPWNALGFQAHFPIFQSMEDAVLDHRLMELCETMERTFQVMGRLLCEAAASGQHDLAKQVRKLAKSLAKWWDKYATFEVTDLPRANGEETLQANFEVAEALADWHQQGETAGDLNFWRQHLTRFKSASSFSAVVDVLLHRGDYGAAMALLINWLSHASEVPLEDGQQSYYDLMLGWTLEVVQSDKLSSEVKWKYLKRFLDLLEANAEEYWDLSAIEIESTAKPAKDDNPFAAAYEGMEYRDSTDDGNESSLADDEPVGKVGAEFPLESQTENITQRIRFLAHVSHLWRLIARQASQFVSQPDLAESLTSWWKAAVQQREQLLPLLGQIHIVPVPEPVGNQASMMEYDRQRSMKERLLETGMTAALDIALAERSLLASSYVIQKMDVPPTDENDWERHAVQLENFIWRSEIAKISPRLETFLTALGGVSLLYKPLDAGGQLSDNYQTRTAQTILRDLMIALPRLGLVQETYQTLKVVRDLERAQSIQGRVVTEFNRLFEFAMQGLTVSVARSSREWKPKPSASHLVQLLDSLSKPFLMLWIDHSHSVRLSTLESIQSKEDWEEVRDFIKLYGSELFHPKFMTLANLRAILSRGVAAYLSYLEEEVELARDDENIPGTKLLAAIKRKRITRDNVIRLLELVLKSVVENYEEYKDYNATTTQSDYGENIFRLISFLRLKSTYERHLWNIKPLIWVHESLAREGLDAAAQLWKQTVGKMTADIARRHVEHLRELQAEHGMQLRTVADLIEERLIAQLDVDRMTALVSPAMAELEVGDTRNDMPTLTKLLEAIDAQSKTTSGSGLDVPAWIRKLEQEGEFVAEQQHFEKSLEPPMVVVKEAEIWEKLSNWNFGIGEVNLLPG